jgi:hypothetical protein
VPVDLTIGPPGRPEVEAEPGDRPEFDDEHLGDEEPAPIDEAVVRRVLRSTGGVLSFVIGDEDVPDHWRFTDAELEDLVPPLTAYIRRQPRLARMVARGDEAAIGLALMGYVSRNIELGREAKKAREDDDGEVDGPAGAAGADGAPAARTGQWPNGHGGQGGHGHAAAPGGGVA